MVAPKAAVAAIEPAAGCQCNWQWGLRASKLFLQGYGKLGQNPREEEVGERENPNEKVGRGGKKKRLAVSLEEALALTTLYLLSFWYIDVDACMHVDTKCTHVIKL